MLKFLKNTKTFLNKGTKHKKIIWKLSTQKIKISKVAHLLKLHKYLFSKKKPIIIKNCLLPN